LGLALRYNLFHGVPARAVHGALSWYWTSRRHRLAERTPRTAAMRAADEYVLHEERDGWTLLSWDGGWEWTRRREAQLHVSRALGCVGFLVFVYDGQYWGYELFDRGGAVDRFVEEPGPGRGPGQPFAGEPCPGRPELVAAARPDRPLPADDVAAVLHRRTRPGGQGALDFLRLLGVELNVGEADEPWWYVDPVATRWRAFAVVPR
jgi:hypothetical protein